MSRLDELHKIFSNVDENISTVVDKLLDEVVFLEERMRELKARPFLRICPTDPTRMKPTAASKLYKECSQSYMNAIRILVGLLKTVDEDAANELLEALKEFR